MSVEPLAQPIEQTSPEANVITTESPVHIEVPAASITPETPAESVAATADTSAPQPKGIREIHTKPFEILNAEFQKNNAELYVNQPVHAPMEFIVPNREQTKVEMRLESIFNAKVIKY